MKKFYRIFVVSQIITGTEYGEYGGYHQYSEDQTMTPYDGKLFESEEEVEKYLEKVVPNDKEYKNCQFIIQKVYVYNN
jgi:hypothetical protein